MKVLSKIDFVTQSNSIHNNLYNYDLISDDISLKLTTKVSIIDPLYGQFTTTIKRHLAGITNVKRKLTIEWVNECIITRNIYTPGINIT